MSALSSSSSSSAPRVQVNAATASLVAVLNSDIAPADARLKQSRENTNKVKKKGEGEEGAGQKSPSARKVSSLATSTHRLRTTRVSATLTGSLHRSGPRTSPSTLLHASAPSSTSSAQTAVAPSSGLPVRQRILVAAATAAALPAGNSDRRRNTGEVKKSAKPAPLQTEAGALNVVSKKPPPKSSSRAQARSQVTRTSNSGTKLAAAKRSESTVAVAPSSSSSSFSSSDDFSIVVAPPLPSWWTSLSLPTVTVSAPPAPDHSAPFKRVVKSAVKIARLGYYRSAFSALHRLLADKSKLRLHQKNNYFPGESLATMHVQVGTWARLAGRCEQAAAHFKSAIVIFSKCDYREEEQVLWAQSELTNVTLALGDRSMLAIAREKCEKALKYLTNNSAGTRGIELTRLLSHLSSILHHLDRSSEALPHSFCTVEDRNDNSQSEDETLALASECAIKHAAILCDLHQPYAAIERLQKALQDQQKLCMGDKSNDSDNGEKPLNDPPHPLLAYIRAQLAHCQTLLPTSLDSCDLRPLLDADREIRVSLTTLRGFHCEISPVYLADALMIFARIQRMIMQQLEKIKKNVDAVAPSAEVNLCQLSLQATIEALTLYKEVYSPEHPIVLRAQRCLQKLSSVPVPPLVSEFTPSSSSRSLVDCAVSLHFLRSLCRRPELSKLSTGEVVSQIILPATAPSRVGREHGCRYVDLMDPSILGRASYFISHRWTDSFSYLVNRIHDFLQANERHLDENVHHIFLWIDIFAIHQHAGEQQKQDLEELSLCIRDSKSGTLVLMDFGGEVLRRTWILFEAHQTVRLRGKPADLRLLFPTHIDRHKLGVVLEDVDIDKTEATVEADRVSILGLITSSGPHAREALTSQIQAAVVASAYERANYMDQANYISIMAGGGPISDPVGEREVALLIAYLMFKAGGDQRLQAQSKLEELLKLDLSKEERSEVEQMIATYRKPLIQLNCTDSLPQETKQ